MLNTPQTPRRLRRWVLQTVDGSRFNSLADVTECLKSDTEYLKSLEPEDRCRVVNAQAERLIKLQGTSDTYLNYSTSRKATHLHTARSKTHVVEEVANRHQTQRDKKLEDQTKLFETWKTKPDTALPTSSTYTTCS